MIKTILQDKYDVDSFSFGEEFIVTLVSDTSAKKLSFGDRIVYFKFHEEELVNPTNFPYYNLLGKSLRTTTLIQNTESELLKKIESDTGGFYSADELKNYILITQNHIMEIVSFDEVKKIHDADRRGGKKPQPELAGHGRGVQQC